MEETDTTFDITVVGGGVIGLSCILHLLEEKPDLRIALVDAPTRPGVASLAAAGMLAPFAEFHEPSPLFDLCREGLSYYAEFLDRFDLSTGDGPELIDAGVLVPIVPGQVTRAELSHDMAAAHGRVTMLKGRALGEAEPALNRENCPEAYLVPGGIIDPRRLHRSMHESVRDRISIHAGSVQSITPECHGPTHVKIDDGREITCHTLLLASGAWSGRLGKLLNIALDMRPIKGQIARLEAPDGFLRHVIHAHEVYLAARPGAGVLIGATSEDAGFDESVSNRTTTELLHLAAHYVPGIRQFPVVESWIGFRPKFEDGAPAIGWSSHVPNLLVATGHYRNGILLTPITGRMIAEEYFSGRRFTPKGPFSPERVGL